MASRISGLVFGFVLFLGSPYWAHCFQASPEALVPDSLRTGFDTIQADQAEQWLNVLAGPTFEGRGTGQQGFMKAAHWVAGKLAEFGVDPMGDGGTYFQMMPMFRLTIDEEQSALNGPDGLTIAAKGNFGVSRFAEQTEAGGQVVFLSLLGARPTLPENVSLRDKVVIYLTDTDASFFARRLIAGQGPAAALTVQDVVEGSSAQLLFDGRRQRSTSVSGTITQSAAEEILKAAGGDPNWFDEAAKTANYFETETNLQLNLRIQKTTIEAPNVIGWIEGSDPDLKHEFVVIGSHLDHLGTVGETMFPGADDNGSGSTAVLSIARAMAANGTRPKRSVLFMWFAAEEMGLVGSRFYVDHPIKSEKDMICMFNIDMVGRNEEKEGETAEENRNTIHLIGSKRGDMELHDLIEQANRVVGFDFEYDEEGVFGRSDQANFYEKGVPVAFLFGGFHPDYHRPTDEPSKINFEKIARAARLYYLAINYACEHGRFETNDAASQDGSK
ncbi:MAG: M20/M25/M40 family metallo-hydrolase [Pirellulaceae bacterium]